MMDKFYKKLNNNKFQCLLCNHYCKLKEGQVGICGVNKNVGDKIECLVYGYIAALNIDPVEKKPLYHFQPKTKTLSLGTVGCNFKCSFCQNHSISQEKIVNKSRYFSPKEIVEIAIKNNCDSISYTYNEPTIFFPYIKDIATLAKKRGLKNIMVTNGFESDEVISSMKGLIDAANVDLKSFNAKYYKKELGGNLEVIKENLKKLVKNGIWIEVTTLVIPGINDSDEELKAIANFIANELGIKVPWHLSAFHPDYKMLNRPRTSYEILKKAFDIGKEAGLKYVYIGNILVDDDTICPKCNHLVLKRVGFETVIDNRKNYLYCKNCNTKLDGVFKMNRITKVAGTFYPDSCDEIQKYFNHFNQILDDNKIDIKLSNIKALICPHAGYIYSGFSANVAYRLVKNKNYKRVIVIGPSHNYGFEGATISLFNYFYTPCGDIEIDLDYANKLKEKFDFLHFYKEAHLEHSTETQAPFIKTYLPNSKIVEIVYSKLDYEILANLVDEVLKDNDNLLIISTDLSHFYNLEVANKLDSFCIESIKKLDLDIWEKGCEACGRIGVKALIVSAKKNNLTPHILDYRTSYDTSKDKESVVGYLSVAFN